jgi:predicted site-specific integrase-resolvase
MTQKRISELEACLILGISTRSALTWRKQGKMPPHSINGQTIEYLLDDVQSLARRIKDGTR